MSTCQIPWPFWLVIIKESCCEGALIGYFAYLFVCSREWSNKNYYQSCSITFSESSHCFHWWWTQYVAFLSKQTLYFFLVKFHYYHNSNAHPLNDVPYFVIVFQNKQLSCCLSPPLSWPCAFKGTEHTEMWQRFCYDLPPCQQHLLSFLYTKLLLKGTGIGPIWSCILHSVILHYGRPIATADAHFQN